MGKIVKAQCFEIRPIDRDYNKKGKKRQPQIEVMGGCLCYALRTRHIYGLIIEEELDGSEDEGSGQP